MSDAMQQHLAEIVEWFLGHGKIKAADELADLMDNEGEASQ